MQEFSAHFEHSLLIKFPQWLLGHVGKRVLTEATHYCSLLIEGIPESPGPVASHTTCILRCPLPRQHALPATPDSLKEQDAGFVGRLRPGRKKLKLGFTSDKSGPSNVVSDGIESGRSR